MYEKAVRDLYPKITSDEEVVEARKRVAMKRYLAGHGLYPIYEIDTDTLRKLTILVRDSKRGS